MPWTGFTPFPYDFGLSAVEETYDIAAEHSDMITFHFDNGVPWSEALAGRRLIPTCRRTCQTPGRKSRSTIIFDIVNASGHNVGERSQTRGGENDAI